MNMRKTLLIALVGFLGACGGSTVVENRPEVVKVPVTVPCVAGERPAAPVALKEGHPDWAGYSLKQKAEYVAPHAFRLYSYGKELNAATGACQVKQDSSAL